LVRQMHQKQVVNHILKANDKSKTACLFVELLDKFERNEASKQRLGDQAQSFALYK